MMIFQFFIYLKMDSKIAIIVIKKLKFKLIAHAHNNNKLITSQMQFQLFFLVLALIAPSLCQPDPYNTWKGATICDDESPSLEHIQDQFNFQSLELTYPNYLGNFSITNPGVSSPNGTLNVALKFKENHFKANTTVVIGGFPFSAYIDYILDRNSRFCQVESTYPSSSTPPLIRRGFSFPGGELIYTTQNNLLVSANIHFITDDGSIINGWLFNVATSGNLANYWTYRLLGGM
jgi:hypothetical protein